MPTTIIIRAEILCLAIILYLIAYSLYCSKYHHAKSNFLVLAFTCFIHTLFAVITELTVNDPGCNVFVNNIYHLIFFAFALLFCLELFRYTLALILPANQARIPVIVAAGICLVGLVFIITSQIKYLKGNGTYYSAGVGPTICFGTGVLIFLIILFVLCFNHKNSAFCSVCLASDYNCCICRNGCSDVCSRISFYCRNFNTRFDWRIFCN